MTGLRIRVYRYNADTKQRREVSSREWSVDTVPSLPLLDAGWPLCGCCRCQDNGTPDRR